MSYRGKNYARGAKAEKRIMDLLEISVEVEKTTSRYPDLLMKIDESTYGIECKSILSFHNGGRPGSAKITATEIAGMNLLVDQNIIPCLIIEIRPRAGPQSNSYFFVDWNLVREKHSKSKPSQMDIGFHWILNNGVNLQYWLQTLEAV